MTRLFRSAIAPVQDSLMKIYGTFLQGHLKKFSEGVQELSTKILQAALALHDKVGLWGMAVVDVSQACAALSKMTMYPFTDVFAAYCAQVSSTFRKTAINFHYEFTVRHLANVFQVRDMQCLAEHTPQGKGSCSVCQAVHSLLAN